MIENPRRIVFVHAHPDDETIGNGATMAKYAAEGAQVTLVTCTRGEQGEVIPPELAHLEGDADRLGDHRVAELAAAMTALGVRDHRFLGDPTTPGRPAGVTRSSSSTAYADSGMAYDHDGGVVPSPNPPAGAFVLAGTEEPAEHLAAVLRVLRPQVVVTYEPGGGYGHPDHVHTHLVTMRGVELAALQGPEGEPGWAVPKVYWTVAPESLTRQALRTLKESLGEAYSGIDPEGRLPSMVVPDDQVTAALDATAFAGAKAGALRAHATQAVVDPSEVWFALSNHVAQPLLAMEFYRLVRGAPGGTVDELGRETDLFG
ncbi:N-acetyl-1-D-myo-inositol-2-amino-2-deoxy-alpha-D-glucopyranoside deacetylase [Kineosporia sp. NBRC 101731]|uniref:N-acetyl-1-D-myo-inositol-2-amino-2-deoxy-alpha- D-glucopyranoside deacetylase n=1 Tax=Kineosporia sp. NBRC 101731 TaxID=3032199 RepID=UPI0024A40979|nr:N-acetyl-1-D-myo-inositol-2-amino-2-deoxy-alpha-D-glucopyranoside deacetylase [Kineosporia sp. NBRC 101731]GLY28553.1 1D-myo-inositol 2-acetamido-2-deoxy-alpha-D-glucopyranoside deacetylase [Kineosporia sp. NBRC 101731]